MSTGAEGHHSLVTASWGLTESSRDAMSFSKGILQAATSDNMPPIALAAAEAFGATIAMSPRTLMVIEKAAGRRDVSAILKFLEAQVGWNTYDSAYHLSRSEAGLRFLGLAAALNTGTAFHGAEALEVMLRESTSRSQLMPTFGQLKSLISALAPKLWQAGFGDRVVGSEILLSGLMGDSPAIFPPPQTIPSPCQIAKLVSALRRVKRLGETEHTLNEDKPMRINIRATSSHAWIYTFIEWCAGVPPDIVGTDGRPILKQKIRSDAIITLFLDSSPDQNYCEMSIEICYPVNKPKELWQSSKDDAKTWHGFVTLAAYGRRKLLHYGISNDPSRTAMAFAVAYTIRCLQGRVRSPSYENGFDGYRPQVLPPQPQIEAAFLMYMGNEMPPAAALLVAERTPVYELPIVLAQCGLLKQRCQCRPCRGNVSSATYEGCREGEFLRAILPISIDILAAALLEDIEHSEALFDSADQRLTSKGVIEEIHRLVTIPSRRPIQVSPVSLYHAVLLMFGLDTEEIGRECLVGSVGGQVIYLALLDKPCLNDRNASTVRRFPGQLQYRNEKHVLVKGSATSVRASEELREAVRTPCNLMTRDEGKLRWTVSRRNDYLALSMAIGPSTVNPSEFFNNHQAALFLDHCPHVSSSALDMPDLNAIYVVPAPENPGKSQLEHPGVNVQIVPVAGNDSQRFFALAATDSDAFVVVRGKSCLACCLSLCRRAKYNTIIL